MKKLIVSVVAGCYRISAISRQPLGLIMILFAMALTFAAVTGSALAQTDITSTVSTLSGYWTVIQTLAIAVVLFVIGRRLLRKV